MEAMGSYRKIIAMEEEQLKKKPLYRMAVDRAASVRFLRAFSAGRLIHTQNWQKKMEDFLG